MRCLALPWCSRVLDRLGDRLGDQKKKFSGVVVALAIVIVSIVEVRAIIVIPSRALPTLEELPAVQFIQDELGNCPVVQLPIGTFPDFPMADGTIDH